MVTPRRSGSNYNDNYSDYSVASNVAVLDRTETVEKDNMSEVKEIMQKNLEKLLNYDRYSEVTEDVATEQVVVNEIALESQEDIRPTSTTMQFGDGDIDQVYSDIERSKTEKKQGYRLNGKGKLVLVLYTLAVTVILALIMLNTGVLASLGKTSASKQVELSKLTGEYQQVVDQIEDISSDEYISDVAENQLNMKK